jgi:hypothetical protein
MNSQPPGDFSNVVPIPLKKRRMTRRRFLASGLGIATAAGSATGGYP